MQTKTVRKVGTTHLPTFLSINDCNCKQVSRMANFPTSKRGWLCGVGDETMDGLTLLLERDGGYVLGIAGTYTF